jgi:hypothetical protein
MKVWLFRALVMSAIGAYVYYSRKPAARDQPPPVAGDTVEPVGAAAGP